jgi:hypothetical protein
MEGHSKTVFSIGRGISEDGVREGLATLLTRLSKP